MIGDAHYVLKRRRHVLKVQKIEKSAIQVAY